MALPRGIRNNNPLNIRHNRANAWLGRYQQQDDPDFVQFAAMQFGTRAAFVIMFNYAKAHPDATLKDLVYHWAPPVENHTSQYLAYVVTSSGVPSFTPLSSFTREDWLNVCHAMVVFENGRSIQYDDLLAGLDMAIDKCRVSLPLNA